MHADSDDPLKTLAGAVAPPPALKDEVRRSLLTRGLVSPGSSRGKALRVLGYAAAATLVFAVGTRVGRWAATGPTDPRPQFLLLLYEPASFAPNADHNALVAEYSAWADSLRRRGVLVGGEELTHEGSVVLARRVDEVTVEAGDVASEAGPIGGFFIIRAASMTDALALARDCPHLRHGGWIALRAITPT